MFIERFVNAFKAGVVIGACLLFMQAGIAANEDEEDFTEPVLKNRAVWVTCFSKKNVLYSKAGVTGLVSFCRGHNINQIYLQVYRGGYAYYDTKLIGRAQYLEMLKKAGTDPIDLLIKEAAKYDIEVHAWVNLLSVSVNRKADIIAKFGEGVLTRDQRSDTSLAGDGKSGNEKAFLKEKQLFLEPGDPRVQDYLLKVVDEICRRYPGLGGIHIDYIRYPMAIPYLPDSRFTKYGLSYGYGPQNIARFKEFTGRNPFTMREVDEYFIEWDNWKRDQVTAVLTKISKNTRAKFPAMKISCAVQPSPERAYSIAMQDWPLWLEKGTIDHVVLMSYTKDVRLFKVELRSACAQRSKGKVYAGIGVFVMGSDSKLVKEECRIADDFSLDGIAFFAYDELNLLGEKIPL